MKKSILFLTFLMLLFTNITEISAKPKGSSLLILARDKFPEARFGSAEKRLFKALQEGKPVSYEDDLKRPVIKANLIQWLCTNRKAIPKITEFGISIRGAHILGDLDLQTANVPFPLKFDNCVFGSDTLPGTVVHRPRTVWGLAIEKFPEEKFGKAEKLIFEAIRQGKSVNFDKANPKRKVNIKSDLLQWLCTDSEVREKIKNKGISISGMNVTGNLDLKNAHIPFPLQFHNSSFTNINLQRSHILSLDMRGSTVKSIDGWRMNVNRSLLLCLGFEASETVRLMEARIGGHLNLHGGKFKDLDMNKMIVKYNAYLREGFIASGKVNLNGAKIGGQLDCGGGSFTTLDMQKASIGKSLFLNNGFVAKDNVYLNGAHIGMQLVAVKGHFHNLYMQKINVGDIVFLRDGFEAIGDVNLDGALIAGHLDCRDGKFTNLDISKSKISKSVYLGSGFEATKKVNLSNTDIGGFVDCSNGSFSNLNMEQAKIKDAVFLTDGFQSSKKVNLMNAKIDGSLDLRNGYFRSLNMEKMTVGDAFIINSAFEVDGVLNLKNAKVNTLKDEKDSWAKVDNLNLEGFEYNAIHDKGSMGVFERIDWLVEQSEENADPQPFEQLAMVYKEEGKNAEAKKVLMAKEENHKRTEYFSELDKSRHFIFGVIFDYGQSPWKTLAIAFRIILFGCIIFIIAAERKLMLPTNPENFEDDSDYPRFNSLLFSVDAFIPLVDLHQANYWFPGGKNGQWCRNYLRLHSLVGWLTFALIFLGLTGIIDK